MIKDEIKIGKKVKYFPVLGEDQFIESEIKSEPWDCCGTIICKVVGVSGGVNIENLEEVQMDANEMIDPLANSIFSKCCKCGSSNIKCEHRSNVKKIGPGYSEGREGSYIVCNDCGHVETLYETIYG